MFKSLGNENDVKEKRDIYRYIDLNDLSLNDF